MKLSCYIVDDEPLAIEVLQAHIENLGAIELKGSFQNPVNAFQALHQQPVDLLFLDIQMPTLTGIDLIKSLANPPMVIFTTAYREYALTGFELDVIDYLLKPISFERFLQAIGKVYKYRAGTAQAHESTADDSILYVQAENRKVKIVLDEILFLESQRDYVKIVTAIRTIVVHEKTSVLEERLRQHGFLRIHRSFIVPISKIESWSVCEVGIGEYVLPIGRTYSSELQKVLKASFGSR